VSWVTLWLYTWNLPMKLGPKHLINCVKYECCRRSGEEEERMDWMQRRQQLDSGSSAGNTDLYHPEMRGSISSVGRRGQSLHQILLSGHPHFVIEDELVTADENATGDERPKSTSDAVEVEPNRLSAPETEMTAQRTATAETIIVTESLRGDVEAEQNRLSGPEMEMAAVEVVLDEFKSRGIDSGTEEKGKYVE